ncbi:hypothetical protein GYMLUDRAFT_145670, partial [Collybiopsis luxurians FD-317 M1]
SQKALILEKPQAPLIVNSVPIPKPGPGEVLVKIMACALNPVDLGVQAQNIIPNVVFPTILGLDIAGDVESLGEGVERIAVGDRVFFPGEYEKEYAGLQQYALARVDFLGKIPSHMSYAEASSIPVTFATAAIPLLAANPVGAGLNSTFDSNVSFSDEPAVVLGGGTSVGQFAIQIYKYLNFNPIITYASSKHTSYLESLGATHVIDRASVPLSALPDTIQAITKLTPIKNIYVATVFTPEATETGYRILAHGGQMATAHPAPQVPEDAGATARKVYGVFASPRIEPNLEFGLEMWKQLPRLVEQGIVKPNRIELLPGGLAAV